MSHSRINELIESYIDNRLSPVERREFEERLRLSAEERRLFWQHLQFEGAIEEAVSAHRTAEWMTSTEKSLADDSPSSFPDAATKPVSFAWRSWAKTWSLSAAVSVLAAACIVVAIVVARPPISKLEATHTSVALLANAWNVEWSEPNSTLAAGSQVNPGRLQIKSGVIGLEFYSGVRMTLEGPADIEIIRIDEIICHTGKMRIQVPHVTKGFRVVTNQTEVLDLGTEFGMEVTADARTEIHVFDGKVEWQERSGTADTHRIRELTAGNAVRLEGNGFSKLPAEPGLFKSRDDLEKLVRAVIDDRQRIWRTTSQGLRHDPRLILYFDFNGEFVESGSIKNLVTKEHRVPDGIVVGCAPSKGRWPERRGIEFKRPGDRVRVYVPGEYDELTYFIWARVDRLKTDHAGLFLTDGFEPGETHWQIYDGRIRLGIGDARMRNKTTKLGPDIQAARFGVSYDSPRLFSDAEEGAWCQLAVTIDNTRGLIRHYYNGRKISEQTLVVRQKLRIGSAELGNWGLPASVDRQPIRNFDGRIDEFIIFQEALSEEEIRKLYDQGHTDAGA